jgi:thiol-disulfide isomerase/thioredoxin
MAGRRGPLAGLTYLVRMRRAVFALIGLGIVAVVVIGLTQKKGHNARPRAAAISASEAQRKLAGAPPELAALHAQSSRLLGGGVQAVEQRLKALRGHPVVLNGWASWCGPCRYEFPFLQKASIDYGRRVAFLGLNAQDNHGDASGFLAKFPVSYPSYEDPADRVVRALHAPSGLPFMIFYDTRGRLSYVHQGSYASAAALERDIRRYALGAGAAAAE